MKIKLQTHNLFITKKCKYIHANLLQRMVSRFLGIRKKPITIKFIRKGPPKKHSLNRYNESDEQKHK